VQPRCTQRVGASRPRARNFLRKRVATGWGHAPGWNSSLAFEGRCRCVCPVWVQSALFRPGGAVSILTEIEGFPGGTMLSEWHQQAACRGRGPAASFGVRGPTTGRCGSSVETCPVRRECLEYGVGA